MGHAVFFKHSKHASTTGPWHGLFLLQSLHLSEAPCIPSPAPLCPSTAFTTPDYIACILFIFLHPLECELQESRHCLSLSPSLSLYLEQGLA